MPGVLFVNACMRESESRPLVLCREYLSSKENVEEVNLTKLNLPPFDAEMVRRRVLLQEAKQWDDPIFDLSHQFCNAEEIVIGAPYWDLSFPAALKVYIEHVSVCDIAFHYTNHGTYEGLCKARHLTYISTSGGFIESGEDLGYEYLCGIARMFGIPEVRYVVAQGLDIEGMDIEAQMDKARAAFPVL